MTRETKYTFIALFVSIIWGYAADWSPVYTDFFQKGNIRDLGSLSRFKVGCKEPANEHTYCSDAFEIPASLLLEHNGNQSIGLGYLVSEIVIGCSENFSDKIFLGDLERPYRKSNIFREYRVVNLDLLKCKQSLLIETWARKTDVRHGLISGHVIVGESAVVDDYKRFLDYLINGVLNLLVLMSVPLIFFLDWFRKIAQNRENAPVPVKLLVFWSLTIFYISGFLQLFFPIASLQMTYRIFANGFLFLSLLYTGYFFASEYFNDTIFYKIMRFLQTPIISINSSILNALLTPAVVLTCFIFISKDWSFLRTYFSIFVATYFLIGPLKFRLDFFIFSILTILGELKILNCLWAPESSVAILFIFFVFVIKIVFEVREEILGTLKNFLNNATSDKLLAARLVHDIRSPLSVLKFLVDEVEWKSEKTEIKEAVLSSLDSISDISKTVLENEKRGLTRLADISPILKCIEETKIIFGKSISFENEIKEDAVFRIDPTTLYRIVQNLLVNACEVNNVKTIRVVAKRLNESHSLIEVINDGDLPSQSLLDKIKSVGGSYGKVQGSGIGLGFCKEEIKKCNGSFDIFIENKMTKVRITL